jgi:hypothetical protein
LDIQNVTFSTTKYPNIRRHFLAALRKGWPRTLVLNRDGAAERRTRLLEGVATRRGYDRDEYPPAVGRGHGKGLTRGADPTGWRADVKLVPFKENRSHGSVMGLKLQRFLQRHEVPLRLLLARPSLGATSWSATAPPCGMLMILARIPVCRRLQHA